jgi:Domain of unknown function (DUF4034)
MKNKICCCLIPLLLLSCSKSPNVVASKSPSIVTRVVTPETKELDDIRTETSTFLQAKDYNKLDELATKFRSSKECYADGTWKLSEVYFALGVSNNIYGNSMYNNIPNTAFEHRLADLRNWITAKPTSITARIALANVQIDYAWNARGGDYASKVTDQGWQLFGEKLDEAAKTLSDAKDLDEKCPMYWTLMMRIALGQQLSRDAFDNIFNQAVHFEPNFVIYYGQRANFLLPRWYGNPGEWERDLTRSADKMGGDDGDVLYAQVVWRLNRSTHFDNIFQENNLAWPRVKSGLEILQSRHPNALVVKSEGARLAVLADDKEAARKYFDDINGQADATIWISREEFLRFASSAYTP